MRVIFNDEDHSYWYGDKKYTSVSGVFKKYKKPFDMEFSSARSAMKKLVTPDEYKAACAEYAFDDPRIIPMLMQHVNEEEFKEVQGSIQAAWKATGKEGRENGTKFHDDRELEALEAGVWTNPFTGKVLPVWGRPESEYDNAAHFENLSKLRDGLYLELVIFDHEKEHAGQADRIFIETHGSVKWFWVCDWKTDQEILDTPKFFHPRKGYAKLLPPFDHMYDTNKNMYRLKMSYYAYMLEKHGLRCGGLVINHCPNYDINEVVDYELAYMKHDLRLEFN